MPQSPASSRSSFQPGTILHNHRHRRAYAALVMEGEYEEVSVDGRMYCTTGSVILHPPWHMHADHFGQAGALVIDIELPPQLAWDTGYRGWQTNDIEALISLLREDPAAALQHIGARAKEISLIKPPLWLQHFVGGLIGDSLSVSLLAKACGVTAEHACRMCQRWYSASPTAIRREYRARTALQMLKAGYRPAEIAVETGFYDQPHMTRIIKAMTESTPAALQAILGGSARSSTCNTPRKA